MLSQQEVDRLRHEFAARLDDLIGEEDDPKKLEVFSRQTGISLRQLSQWRNPRHLNWPSVKNLVALSKGADVSIDWLVLGKKNGKHR